MTSNLKKAQTVWETLQQLKLKHLETWEPQRDSLDLSDLGSIPEMAKELNKQMAACMDVEEIHAATFALRDIEASMGFDEFCTWNRGELERAQTTGELMSQISSKKLLLLMGL